MQNIASGAPSPTGQRPCDEKHRIKLSFADGPATHAMKYIASGAPSPTGRRPCDEKHRIRRSFADGPATMR